MLQVIEETAIQQDTLAMNSASMLGLIRQHELTETAEALNSQLQVKMAARKKAEAALILEAVRDLVSGWSLCWAVLFVEHGGMAGEGYPSDVTDEECAFVLPYLLLCREDSPQRKHDLRTVFDAVRYVARTGGQWRFLPRYLPPWWVVYQQMQRWIQAGCFEFLVEDVRSLLREWGGRKGQPTAVCIDSRTLQSTPESGARAGYDGARRRKGSKVHIAVDTLGRLLALTVTPADQGDRTQVAALAEQIQKVTGGTVEMAYVDQGYTGPNAAEAAQQHGLRLEVVKHPMARCGGFNRLLSIRSGTGKLKLRTKAFLRRSNGLSPSCPTDDSWSRAACKECCGGAAVLALVAIIVTGLTHFHRALAFDFPAGAFHLGHAFYAGLGAGMLIAAYDYWGYYNVCFLGAEVREPQRTIPLAVLGSIAIVGTLYLLMKVSVLEVITWHDLTGNLNGDARMYTMAIFMQRVWGWCRRACGGGGDRGADCAALAASASGLALLLGYSQIPYAAAKSGNFPAVFAKVHPKHQIPHVSLLTLGGMTLFYCLFRLQEVIATLVVIRILFQFLLQAIAGLLPRHRRARVERGTLSFRMPLYPLPVVVALCRFMFILFSRPNFLKEMRTTGVILAAGERVFGVQMWPSSFGQA